MLFGERVFPDQSSPFASLAIKLSDEVQYRCAGFVQAEIEQFAELVGLESQPVNEDSDEDSDEEQSDSSKRNVREKKVSTLGN